MITFNVRIPEALDIDETFNYIDTYLIENEAYVFDQCMCHLSKNDIIDLTYDPVDIRLVEIEAQEEIRTLINNLNEVEDNEFLAEFITNHLAFFIARKTYLKCQFGTNVWGTIGYLLSGLDKEYQYVGYDLGRGYIYLHFDEY